MKAFPLGAPKLDLPRWPATAWEAWESHTREAEVISRTAGTGRRFEELLTHVRQLLRAGDVAALEAGCAQRRFLRAVVTVWSDDAALARATMTPTVLTRLMAQSLPSRLTAIRLAGLFFTHFDLLERWHTGLALTVRDAVRRAVGSQRVAHAPDVVEALRAHEQMLLEPDGPLRLARHLVATGGDVRGWMRANQLTAFADTRFGRQARDAFYLAAIEAADAERGDHAFLKAVTDEVMARQRTETTDEDQTYFGHLVLVALTNKPTRHPSDVWLQATLAYAGDPRLTQTDAWRTWWQRVPGDNLQRAIRWMKGTDLRAYLDGVEDYAYATGNQPMISMLERRKRLLLGLYAQDRINDVRLVLGDGVRDWVRRNAAVDLIEVARLTDSSKQDTAVIYVDCGDFWLVEGSHNFKLNVYVKGPVGPLADRRQRAFSGSDLRDALPERHLGAHGRLTHMAFPHQGLEWLRKALDFLRFQGVVVDERGLMSPNDYAEIMRKRAAEGYWRWR